MKPYSFDSKAYKESLLENLELFRKKAEDDSLIFSCMQHEKNAMELQRDELKARLDDALLAQRHVRPIVSIISRESLIAKTNGIGMARNKSGIHERVSASAKLFDSR